MEGKTTPLTLTQLAASKVPGYAHQPATKFAKSLRVEDLHDVIYAESVERSINSVGRIPAISRCNVVRGMIGCAMHTHIRKMEKEMYPGKAIHERETGKFRGTAVFRNAIDDNRITLRVDSWSVPEMWIEITLTREELQSALEEIDNFLKK
jgi:hypothetical protein